MIRHLFPPEQFLLQSGCLHPEGVSWRREGLLFTSKTKSSRGIEGCHCCLKRFSASFKEEPTCVISPDMKARYTTGAA